MSSLDKFLSDHPALNRQGQQKYTSAVWGGISQEYDALKAQVKIAAIDSADVNNLTGDMLDELLLRFTGIQRTVNQSDESRMKTLFSFFRRSGRKSWATPHALIGAFAYYFDTRYIYLLENAVKTNLIVDPGFESFDTGVKTAQFGSWIPSGSSVEVVAPNTFQGARALKLSGTGAVSQTVAAVSPCLILTTPYFGNVDVTVRSSLDNYYYDFATNTWSSTSKKLSLANSTEYYKINESPIFLSQEQNVTVTYSAVSGGTVYIDNLSIGQKPTYPYIRMLVITMGQGGGYLNNWPGTTDPVNGLDYDNATFMGIDFIGGEGSGMPTTYYIKELEYIKPAGVKAGFEFIGRG